MESDEKKRGRMIISIMEELRIKACGDKVPEFIIQRRRTVGTKDKQGRVPKNAGRHVWENVAYMGTLRQALLRCIDYTATSSDEYATLSQMNQHINEWTRKIHECAK